MRSSSCRKSMCSPKLLELGKTHFPQRNKEIKGQDLLSCLGDTKPSHSPFLPASQSGGKPSRRKPFAWRGLQILFNELHDHFITHPEVKNKQLLGLYPLTRWHWPNSRVTSLCLYSLDLLNRFWSQRSKKSEQLCSSLWKIQFHDYFCGCHTHILFPWDSPVSSAIWERKEGFQGLLPHLETPSLRSRRPLWLLVRVLTIT